MSCELISAVERGVRVAGCEAEPAGWAPSSDSVRIDGCDSLFIPCIRKGSRKRAFSYTLHYVWRIMQE